MNIDFDKLVRKFEENPVAFMAAASGVLIGVGKVIESVGNSRGSHAYAKAVNHKIKLDRHRQA